MGRLYFSLPLKWVGETMRPLPLQFGEALIRGQLTSVYDLGMLASGEPSSHGRWVTLKAPRPIALAVDAVLGVKALDESQLSGPLLAATAAPAELTGEARAALLEARRVPPEALS